MKILEKNDKNLVKFESLQVGEVFRCGGIICMKIKAIDCLNEDDCVETMQAVSLTTGDLRNFFSSDPVEWLDKAQLILN